MGHGSQDGHEDSYNRALNRQSGNDEREERKSAQNAFGSVCLRTSGTGEPQRGDRTKYNTLPRTEPTVNTKQETARRKRPESDGTIHREAPQRSGIYYPSPDTDDDQRSVPPERKKKSAFKRVKERLSLAFETDRDREKKKSRKKGDKYKSPSRVKPHHCRTHDAFGTPHDDKCGVGNCIEITQEPQGQNGLSIRGSVGVPNESTQNRTKGDDLSSETNRGQGFLRSVRNSFRRKTSTKISKGKDSADATPGTSSSSHSPASHDNQLADQRRGLPGKNTSQPVEIPRMRKTFEEQFIDADDDITAFFRTLIDPEGTSHDNGATVPDFHPAAARSRPDKYKLKLEDQKFKPRSFDQEFPKQCSKGFRLSPFGRKRSLEEDVEIDGVDVVDGLVGDESELSLADVSQQEKQRKYDYVAQRLRAIGDSVVIRRASSAGSSSEHKSHTHRWRLSQFEEEVLLDLRQYGDNIDGDIRGRVRSALSNISVSETIIPSVMQILRAQDYSSFQTVVKREIEHIEGWELVAWYTYLIKTTMGVAQVGQFLGRKVKNHATRYFLSNIRTWIQSQPQGWTSVQGKTDVDTKLDH